MGSIKFSKLRTLSAAGAASEVSPGSGMSSTDFGEEFDVLRILGLAIIDIEESDECGSVSAAEGSEMADVVWASDKNEELKRLQGRVSVAEGEVTGRGEWKGDVDARSLSPLPSTALSSIDISS